MATELGRVDATGNAFVLVKLSVGEIVECIIDTGFSGELMLPRTLVDQLQLVITGEQEFTVAGGGLLPAFTSLVEIEWLGGRHAAEVIVSEGTDMLLGTVLLAGTRLKIDYVKCTVEIEKP